MARCQPGRTRWRLSEVILRDLGVVVSPYDLWTQEGAYRNHRWDLARWGCNHCKFTKERAKELEFFHDFSISSWDTMGDCVRHGITFVGDPKRVSILIEVCSKGP